MATRASFVSHTNPLVTTYIKAREGAVFIRTHTKKCGIFHCILFLDMKWQENNSCDIEIEPL